MAERPAARATLGRRYAREGGWTSRFSPVAERRTAAFGRCGGRGDGSERFAAFERDFRAGASAEGLSEHSYARAYGVWEESAALTVQGDRATAGRYAVWVRDRYGQEAVATFEEDDRAPGAMYRLEGSFDREAVREALTRHGFPAGRLVGGALEVGVQQRVERKGSKHKDARLRIAAVANGPSRKRSRSTRTSTTALPKERKGELTMRADNDNDDEVYDYEESRRFFAEQGVALLPPDHERYPPGSTTIIFGGVAPDPEPEPRKGQRVQVCIETGEPDDHWEGDYTVVRAPHTEDGERRVWIAPTGELDAAKERRKAGANPPGYPEASPVSLGGVRLLTADRECAAQAPVQPPVPEPEPVKENA